MKVTTSYPIEVRGINKHFRVVTKIWQKMFSYLVPIVEEHWVDEIELYRSTKERSTYVRNLVHSSGGYLAKYDFDEKFPKTSSYFLTAILNAVVGHVSSYHSNLENWQKDNRGNSPTLSFHANKLPVFYNKNMFLDDCDEPNTVRIKLFVNNDWSWVKIKLKPTDVKYILRHCNMSSISCPTLERRNKKWFLRFTFEDKVDLSDTPLPQRKICAVDMGINTDATCSVMTADGTILNRKFIDYKSDKDYLYHTLNKIKSVSKKYGSHNTSKLWRIAKFHNEELGRKVSKAITDYAKEQGCDVIVFEYLDFGKKKLRGKSKQKLLMWRKQTIQATVINKAHKQGMRISRVCAWGTSKFAFDGSGVVSRGKDANLGTYSLCKFQSGKVYNCDLSASYNIGARYFIREIKKTTTVKQWSQLVAKVPLIEKRSQCTLSTLKELVVA